MAAHTIPETAKILGVSRGTVYNLIARGDLVSYDSAPSGSKKAMTRITDEAIAAFQRARARRTKALRNTA